MVNFTVTATGQRSYERTAIGTGVNMANYTVAETGQRSCWRTAIRDGTITVNCTLLRWYKISQRQISLCDPIVAALHYWRFRQHKRHCINCYFLRVQQLVAVFVIRSHLGRHVLTSV